MKRAAMPTCTISVRVPAGERTCTVEDIHDVQATDVVDGHLHIWLCSGERMCYAQGYWRGFTTSAYKRHEGKK